MARLIDHGRSMAPVCNGGARVLLGGVLLWLCVPEAAAVVTFEGTSGVYDAVFATQCTGCHTGALPNSGVPTFDSYNNLTGTPIAMDSVKAKVFEEVQCRVNWVHDTEPDQCGQNMPQGGSQLHESLRTLIDE